MNQRPVAHDELVQTMRDAIRVRHYSARTERAYVNWVRRYILFHHKRLPWTWASQRSPDA